MMVSVWFETRQEEEQWTVLLLRRFQMRELLRLKRRIPVRKNGDDQRADPPASRKNDN
jgi:hypothetical protein